MTKINKKKLYLIFYLIILFLGVYTTLIINSILIAQFINIQNKVKNFETNFDFDSFNEKINNFEKQFNYLIKKINYYENYSQDYFTNNLNNITMTFDSINNLLLRINSIENTIDTLNKNINNTFNFIYNPNFGFT